MDSLILIGMPGVGKSTLGVLLAKERAQRFVDTDLLIQQHAQKALQQILDESGYLALRSLEEQLILTQDLDNAVVATGGSAVYGDGAMTKLQQLGPVVYLSCGLNELRDRIGDIQERGVAAAPGLSLAAIAAEREPLYRQYADIEIKTDGLSPAEVIDAVLNQLN